jgi:hypothetical protein
VRKRKLATFDVSSWYAVLFIRKYSVSNPMNCFSSLLVLLASFFLPTLIFKSPLKT